MKLTVPHFLLKFKGNIMGKQYYKPNPQYTRIFDDLDRLKQFCVNYGYRFNESDLYNFKSYAWQQYNKFSNNKNAKNMWDEDTKRFSGIR